MAFHNQSACTGAWNWKRERGAGGMENFSQVYRCRYNVIISLKTFREHIEKSKSRKPVIRLRDEYFHDRFIRQKVGKVIAATCNHLSYADFGVNEIFFSLTILEADAHAASKPTTVWSVEIIKWKFIVLSIWFGVNVFAIVARCFVIVHYHPIFRHFSWQQK